MNAPFVVGFYKTAVFVEDQRDTDTVALLQRWCRSEGYVLGVPYRSQDGNGAFDAMIDALRKDEDVPGVIVPSLDHLGPEIEDRVSRITATGKQLFVACPTDVRR